MKIEIRNRFNAELIFSIETDSWKVAIEAAIKAKADLRYADLTSADLTSANLTSADLRYADLRYADLRSANLRYANLRYADLTSADLTSADLTSANLRSANLRYADLTSADLRSANLRYADLTSANLTSADLRYADLRYADLRSANLRSANLRYANLRYADLRSADLTSANLEPIRNDFWSVLLFAQKEIKALRKAIIDGKIDGSVYSGDCACLVGTIAKQRKCSAESLEGNLKPDSSRPIERFFMGIKPGDTPENNPVSKIALEWLDTFAKQI